MKSEICLTVTVCDLTSELPHLSVTLHVLTNTPSPQSSNEPVIDVSTVSAPQGSAQVAVPKYLS